MTRRTTLSADADDLAVLEREAARHGETLTALLRDLVAREADTLRSRNRPRFGVGRSGGTGVARRSVEDEDAPARAGARRTGSRRADL